MAVAPTRRATRQPAREDELAFPFLPGMHSLRRRADAALWRRPRGTFQGRLFRRQSLEEVHQPDALQSAHPESSGPRREASAQRPDNRSSQRVEIIRERVDIVSGGLAPGVDLEEAGLGRAVERGAEAESGRGEHFRAGEGAQAEIGEHGAAVGGAHQDVLALEVAVDGVQGMESEGDGV
jgi:hypothetical protein